MSYARGMRPRHAARTPLTPLISLAVGVFITLTGCFWSCVSPGTGTTATPESTPVEQVALPPAPAVAEALPAVTTDEVETEHGCGKKEVIDALAAGDDAAVVANFGGGVAFRDAILGGLAPCISLTDPSRFWVVVNKVQPVTPVEYVPQRLRGTWLPATSSTAEVREDAAADLEAMAQAVKDSGTGVIGINNGYRGYDLQRRNYNQTLAQSGTQTAEQLSARPGFSEHQTGLALDVISCENGCSSIAGFDSYVESDWVAEHAWEYGFIVRYEADTTGTTGYVPEPWHLRYVGREIAAAYHHGGFHTLEDFFALPAAPDYAE